ncbi:MAG: RnfABCDGE type electron transport complex subunit C [Oscillospiraceae bacterium]|jgi:electron transport complex protein RnfC|nr:RnfABCDGE type electron transport complex subunit C [Oscillospiraceae bacterium]
MILNTVRLPHFDASADKKTVKLPLPKKVIISLSQSIGASCEPLVKKGDAVLTGQLIGDSDAFVSVPVHASVSGTVTGETEILSVNGRLSRAVVIHTDSLQKICEDLKPPVINNKESFLKAIRGSGSVGLGGAGFPTHVKLSFDSKKTPVDSLIINGAECEPYITSDYREIIENSQNIANGIKLVMKYLEIPTAIIGIERDKPLAIERMREIVANNPEINVKPLSLRYPQGAEKILIYKTTGRTVREDERPYSAGCLVLNISTVAFIAEYVKTGIPMIKRRLTIDGDIVNKAVNVSVPIGTTLSELLQSADARIIPDRVIFGGPMMGSCVYDPDTPVGKTTSALLLFGNSKLKKESACIRCGKCIGSCSMNLSPVEINKAYDASNKPLLKKLRVGLCMNCGSCSYVCPAKRNISEKNQLAKQLIKG